MLRKRCQPLLPLKKKLAVLLRLLTPRRSLNGNTLFKLRCAAAATEPRSCQA